MTSTRAPYRYPGKELYDSYKIAGVSTAGVLHRVAMVWIVPLFVVTLALDIVTAYFYHKLGDGAGKAYDALIIAGAMQLLLTFLLSIRGRWGHDVFRWALLQMLLVFHILLPNAIITGLWTARMQMDAVLHLTAKQDHETTAAFTLLTVTMVFSNLFSSTCAAILFVNSAFFYAATEQDAADRLTPP